MKNRKLAVRAAVVLLTFMIGVTGCKRKRNNASSPQGADQSAAEASGTPTATSIPPFASGVNGVASTPAPHPGEALDPAGLKIAMDQFQLKMQRPPNDWQEMIDAKVLSKVPTGKNGKPLSFSEYMEFTIHRSKLRP